MAGECRRYPPTRGQLGWSFASTDATYTCGEWADGSITPEHEEQRELIRRFAVAIVAGGVSLGQAAWDMAEQLADAEPGNSGREI